MYVILFIVFILVNKNVINVKLVYIFSNGECIINDLCYDKNVDFVVIQKKEIVENVMIVII